MVHAVTIFISFADEDKEFLANLLRQLSGLMREGRIKCYHRHQISPGNEWREQAKKDLFAADIILLLVSSFFIASDYCYREEAILAMAQHKSRKARVIPVIVQPVEWEQLVFGGLKSLPEGEAVSMWSDKEEAFASIVRGLKGAIDDLKAKVRDTLHDVEKPLSTWNVPYWRNPVFTGREDVLVDLQKAFSSLQTVLRMQALSGLAGVGKTQVAVEYAYKHANNYQAVLWVHADSPEILLSSFVNLAETLNLPERNETDQHLIIRTVKQWLQRNTRWLLIVDNLEDVDLLQDIVPSPHSGHILVTMRSHRTGHLVRRVDLLPMRIDDGALLLLRRAKLLPFYAALSEATETDGVLAREVAREADGLPLALDQAGAYIEETGRGLSDYVSLYQKYSSALLSRRGASSRDHPASVATTFSLSFEKVKALSPGAAELLELCAFLHPDAIPEDLIIDGASAFHPVLRAVVLDPLELDQAIEGLLKFSLIQRESDQKILIVHRLVQEVVKGAMSEIQQQEYVEQTVRVIATAFPHVEFPNWPLCQRYLPQAQACAKLIQQRSVLLPEASQLLYRVGVYLTKRGLYKEAETLLIQASAIEETLLGTDHLRILPVLNALASVYYKNGKYSLVEPLLLRSLALGEKILEGKHPEMGDSLNTLARTYHKQGRYNEAEPLFQRALALQQQILGGQHPDVAATMNNLASLYNRQGKYEQAETLYTQALAIKQQVLSAQDPRIASSLHNLALLYSRQGKYEQAEVLYMQALKIFEQALGQEHPDVALALSNLAGAYQEQGRYVEAEPLYQRIFLISHKLLEPEHPQLVTYYNDLARLYFLQARYTEAETTVRQALTLGEKTLGANHQRVGTSVKTLADIYKAQQRYLDAEACYQRALDICEKALGPTNVRTALVLDGYADLLQMMERYEEAEALKKRADAIRNEQLTN
jgi:tetratricopeptide (TPR) repeat protein